MKIEYPVHITKQDDGYLVAFPDFPEATTDGETLEEALFNASEVLTLTLEGRVDEGLPIPDSSKAKTRHKIAPAARVQTALLLRKARGTRQRAQLARALETSWAAAAKLEDPRHWPSLRQVEKAAAAVGKRVVVIFEEVVP